MSVAAHSLLNPVLSEVGDGSKTLVYKITNTAGKIHDAHGTLVAWADQKIALKKTFGLGGAKGEREAWVKAGCPHEGAPARKFKAACLQKREEVNQKYVTYCFVSHPMFPNSE
jgi:hypothetical protein